MKTMIKSASVLKALGVVLILTGCSTVGQMPIPPVSESLAGDALPGSERTQMSIPPVSEILAGFVKIPGRDWLMCKTEVTQDLWEAIMGENPSTFRGAKRPVENVSWNDCHEFIKRLNKHTGLEFRLPTEDEWEYACRAGSIGDWGNVKKGQEGYLDAMGWYEGNSNLKTQPVAQKVSNAWGLCDMHGNVGEWTSTSVGNGRMIRGGGFHSALGDCTAGNRRSWFFPDLRCDRIGFRLVLQEK